MAYTYGFRCDACNHLAWDATTVTGWTCPACHAGKMEHDIDVPFGALEQYAWPGGYPVIYLPRGPSGDVTGDVLCADCAMRERDAGNMPHGMLCDVYMEGPSEFCAECNREIESAYGDPDAPDKE